MKETSFLFVGILLAVSLSAVPAKGADGDFGGSEITFTAPAKGVLFSHQTHVGDLGFDCEACHDDLFEMEALAAQEKNDFTMRSMENGSYCGACHDGSTAFAADTQCSACHLDGGEIFFTEPVESVLFSHKLHGESGLECSDCHSDIFAMKSLQAQVGEDFTMDSLYEGKYCGTCHDGEMAFASDSRCAVCHTGVKGMAKMAEGASGTQGKPQAH